MAEWICRTLRDGGLEGEHAPALTINDTITCPLGSFVFDHILSHLSSFIFSQKSQSSGIVLVALSRSPLHYEQLLKSKGHNVLSTSTWFKVLDCYMDPLGWKSKLVNSGSIRNDSLGSSITIKMCENVKDLDELLTLILQLGKDFSGDGKGRFVVAIDSISEMLRHTSVSAVASLLSKLRSHGQVSSLFWLLHSDLHETRATAALEYMSSMKATLEQMAQSIQRGNSESLSLMEHNLRRGKFSVHVKRRNGRVRMMRSMLRIQASILHLFLRQTKLLLKALCLRSSSIYSCLKRSEMTGQKLSFLLSTRAMAKPFRYMMVENLSVRAKLTFKEDSGRGEIIYFRDSDDEMPDSDEDPDDDLDI